MAKVRREITITLAQEDLQAAVTEWARAQGIIPEGATGTAYIDVGTRTTGYGMAERDEPYGEVVLRVVGP